MKLRHFATLGLLGYAGYQTYKNRNQIKTTVKDVLERKDTIASDLDNINRNLSLIKIEGDKVQKISQDLTYKFRVFDKETQAHLAEINRLMAKYKQSEN